MIDVHVFDIDHTLLKGSTAYSFLQEALAQGDISFRRIIRLPFLWLLYKLALIDSHFIEDNVSFLRGMEESRLADLSAQAFEKRSKGKLYQEGLQLIAEIGGQHKVLFATSAFSVLVRPLEDFLRTGEFLTSHLEFENGKATGLTLGDPLFGENKKKAVDGWLKENQIDPRRVCFYSDSYNDLPLLEYCGKAVAVNPDHRLAREARRQNWEILYFSRTLKKESSAKA